MNHDAEHMRRIIQLEPAVEQLFNEFLAQVSPSLAKLKYDARRRAVWSRNPLIEKQVDQVLRDFTAKYRDLIQAHMLSAWELSEKKNDSTFMKLIKGAGIVVGGSMLLRMFNRQAPGPGADPVTLENILAQKRNEEAARSFLKNRLSEVISPRVWNLAGENKKIILKTVESGILQGRSAAKISRDLRQLLNDPNKRFRRVRDPETGKLKLSRPMASYHPGQGVYRSSFKNALRLCRNEVNMSYRMADLERWRDNPTILGYEVKRSASGIPCEICDSLVGRYPKSFTWLTWHVSCYCYAIPILADRDQFVSYLQTGDLKATPIQGIPRNAAGYVKKNSDKLLKMSTVHRPYWLRDNFFIKEGEIKLNI